LFHAIVHLRAARQTGWTHCCFLFRAALHICHGITIFNQAAIEICRRRGQAIMADVTETAVRGVLDAIIDPATGRSVVALGMVGGIAIRGGHVAVTLDVDPARGPEVNDGVEQQQRRPLGRRR